MLEMLFVYLLGVIFATAGLLFAILAYNQKNDAFFWLGLILTGVVTLGIVVNVRTYIQILSNYSEPAPMMTIGAWLMAIVFLAIAKTKKKPQDDNVTDAFLDDIINSEQEDWDPES